MFQVSQITDQCPISYKCVAGTHVLVPDREFFIASTRKMSLDRVIETIDQLMLEGMSVLSLSG